MMENKFNGQQGGGAGGGGDYSGGGGAGGQPDGFSGSQGSAPYQAISTTVTANRMGQPGSGGGQGPQGGGGGGYNNQGGGGSNSYKLKQQRNYNTNRYDPTGNYQARNAQQQQQWGGGGGNASNYGAQGNPFGLPQNYNQQQQDPYAYATPYNQQQGYGNGGGYGGGYGDNTGNGGYGMGGGGGMGMGGGPGPMGGQQQQQQYGGNIPPESPKGGHVVYCYGIGQRATQEELFGLFGQFGRILRVDIIIDFNTGLCKGYAFVAFEQYNEALVAIQNLNGTPFHGRQLQVRMKG